MNKKKEEFNEEFEKRLFAVEKEVGLGPKEDDPTINSVTNACYRLMGGLYGLHGQTICERVKSLRDDFKGLDSKFDRLVDYLGVEFVDTKITTEGGAQPRATKDKQTVRKVAKSKKKK